MKNKKNKKDKKNKKGLTTPTVPVPPAVTELSEEDLKEVTGGVGQSPHLVPQVGDEVLVSFEHGDPNRPIIVGKLWNG